MISSPSPSPTRPHTYTPAPGSTIPLHPEGIWSNNKSLRNWKENMFLLLSSTVHVDGLARWGAKISAGIVTKWQNLNASYIRSQQLKGYESFIVYETFSTVANSPQGLTCAKWHRKNPTNRTCQKHIVQGTDSYNIMNHSGYGFNR